MTFGYSSQDEGTGVNVATDDVGGAVGEIQRVKLVIGKEGSGAGVGDGLTWTSIAISSSGDNTVIAAPGAGNYTRIVKIVLVADAAVDVKLKDGAATDLTGPMAFAANTGMAVDFNFWPAELSENTAFIINLSAAVGVNGFVQSFTDTIA